MAVTLNKIVRFQLGAIVSSAVDSVAAVRRTEQASHEAEFQKAIADGTMSYAAQIDYRKKQLADEKTSGFADPEYITTIETSIGTLNKLARYEKVRTMYKTSLDSYEQGRGDLAQSVSLLSRLFDQETDPVLKEELRAQLSAARTTQVTNEQNAITNRATLAEKDGSVALLDKSIKEVGDRIAKAKLSGNDAEASKWDNTLQALTQSKATVQIQDGMNDLTFNANQFDYKSGDKLSYLGGLAKKADQSTPITYNGVRYNSVADYWNHTQASYIANGYFDDLTKEISAENDRIASGSQFGTVPLARVKAVSDFYSGLTSRPEFAPYANTIEQQRVATVDKLAKEFGTAIDAEAGATGNYDRADAAYLKLEQNLGIKLNRAPIGGEGSIASTVTSTAPGTTPYAVAPIPVAPRTVNGQPDAPVAPSVSGAVPAVDKSKFALPNETYAQYNARQEAMKTQAPIVPAPVTPVVPPLTPTNTAPAPQPLATPTPVTTPKPTVTPTPVPGLTKFQYVDKSQKLQTVEAASLDEAKKKATNVDPSSGFMKL